MMAFDYGDKLPDGQHERHPTMDDLDNVDVPRNRLTYVHNKCGAATRIGLKIGRTYMVNPKFYSSTFCMGCGKYFPVGEFKWDDGVTVGESDGNV